MKHCPTIIAAVAATLLLVNVGAASEPAKGDNESSGASVLSDGLMVESVNVGQLNRGASEVPTARVSTSQPILTGRAGEKIDWCVVSGGGGTGSSASYTISGTAGQTAVGLASSPSFDLSQGFWQAFGAGSGGGCCLGLTGNINNDPGGSVDLSDLIYLVNYLFLGGPSPDCLAAANTNGDAGCSVDLSDLIHLVNYLFLGGPAPAACLPACE